VLFTKADAIPHFDAFVRNFSADEAREPLGASIEPDLDANGTYAERVTPRLERAMQEIYRSLAARRIPVLAREHAAEWKPPAYEFPREVRKLAPLVVEFLLELGKPSALKGSPVLRGFYFTGVQAVFVNDATPEYSPMMQQAREVVGARSATGVFSAHQMAAAAGAAAVPSTPRTRKVPRWDFLPRLYREVILADEPAIRLTQGGERVGFLRRATLAGGRHSRSRTGGTDGSSIRSETPRAESPPSRRTMWTCRLSTQCAVSIVCVRRSTRSVVMSITAHPSHYAGDCIVDRRFIPRCGMHTSPALIGYCSRILAYRSYRLFAHCPTPPARAMTTAPVITY
jgi:hypothetical protein